MNWTNRIPAAARGGPFPEYAAFAVLLALALAQLIRTAWICDDAVITFRVVLNFLHDAQPVFNAGERVQAYTHPLWFLLLSELTFLTKNTFLSAHVLSIAFSLAAMALLLFRVAKGFAPGLLAAFVLLASKASVDFAASGLENPLSNFLILLAILAAEKAVARAGFQSLWKFFALGSLLYLTRPDLILLFAPLALYVVFRRPRLAENQKSASPLPALLLGALPALLWTGFALYYYGAPFPNPAYAKLGAGIPLDERLLRGWVYFMDSLARDPLTLFMTGYGIVRGFAMRGIERALAAGILVYLVYILFIGGDFMSGRFFVPSLVMAAAITARSTLPKKVFPALAGVAVILALLNAKETVLGQLERQAEVPVTGIADERAYYFHQSGLLNQGAGSFKPQSWKEGLDKVLVACGGLGEKGLKAGPSVHIIDVCGLADPLLSRLPTAGEKPRWRTGHFIRRMPKGYPESVAAQENLIEDETTYDYYEAIRLITRGPLNDPARWMEILRLNLGLIELPGLDYYKRDGDVYVPPS